MPIMSLDIVTYLLIQTEKCQEPPHLGKSPPCQRFVRSHCVNRGVTVYYFLDHSFVWEHMSISLHWYMEIDDVTFLHLSRH
jgi:hypothetical protein